MSKIPARLETPRLILRQWDEDDYAPFASMVADPRVMEFFPSTLNREESNAAVNRYRTFIHEHGWGLWAAESKETSRFIGFVGLNIPAAELPCSPCVEIGWRLCADEWGKGLACEAAGASLDFAFNVLKLREVVAFTAKINRRSQALMQRLGMRHNIPDDFDNPVLPPGHPLRPHVLYRMDRNTFDSKHTFLTPNMPPAA